MTHLHPDRKLEAEFALVCENLQNIVSTMRHLLECANPVGTDVQPMVIAIMQQALGEEFKTEKAT